MEIAAKCPDAAAANLRGERLLSDPERSCANVVWRLMIGHVPDPYV